MSRKTVLITGCSPGSIGEALTLEFIQRGFDVCATSLPSESLIDLQAKGAVTLPLDVTSAESVRELKVTVSKVFEGKLDYLINCAGINYVMPALDIDINTLHQVFDINLFGVVRMVQAFTPLLIRSTGTIVNISSLAAYAPYVFGASYNASKAALLAFDNTLRIELSPWNVSVQTVLAGPIVSGLMTRSSRALPADSLYQPIRQQFEGRTHHAKHGVQAMPTAPFAADVVNDLTRTRKPKLNHWMGPFKWQVWLLECLGLLSVWQIFFRRRFGLDKLP
ncbi:hypothetical protein D6C93_09392 [Aureobasidium pullulans]|nr:hypothetical protein D6C93_09392 [Aureobasidium pullulans]